MQSCPEVLQKREIFVYLQTRSRESGSDGRVARQRSAKPCTAVRIRFRPRMTPSALQRGFSFSPPPHFSGAVLFRDSAFFRVFRGREALPEPFGQGWLPVFCSPRAVPRMRFRAKRVEGCRSAASGPGGRSGMCPPPAAVLRGGGKIECPGPARPGHRNSGRAGRQRASRRKTALS